VAKKAPAGVAVKKAPAGRASDWQEMPLALTRRARRINKELAALSVATILSAGTFYTVTALW
jgi:hypothetical protein